MLGDSKFLRGIDLPATALSRMGASVCSVANTLRSVFGPPVVPNIGIVRSKLVDHLDFFDREL